MPSFLDDPLWTPADLEDATGRPEGFWAKLRMRGDGPRFIKIGGKVRYRRSAVEAYLQAQERTSTSDPGPAAREDTEPGAGSPARRPRRSTSTHAA
jgi:hypothetical protein